MFKFEFKVDEIDDQTPFATEQAVECAKEKSLCSSAIEWYNSEEVFPSKESLEKMDVFKLNSIKNDDIGITHIVSGFLLEDIREHDDQNLDLKKAEDNHSDLIPGIYEGGAKIWECTDDLLVYLSKTADKEFWKSKNVLDLGCGSGLLGLYAYKQGAKVDFQDYNKDVLEKITIPNMLLNASTDVDDEDNDDATTPIDLDKLQQNVRFFSGDWSNWSNTMKPDDLYDIILSSETIYNPENHKKLLNCFDDRLKPKGIILIAAKSYYFGVGGGLRQFESLISEDNRFKSQVKWISTEGVNREILEIKRIK